MNLNVLIVEAQEVFRAGLRSIMTSDFRVSEVYEAKDERDLRNYLSSCIIDLIVIDQEALTDFSILQTKKFVVLAVVPNITKLKAAYKYGACGYLSINVSAELLCTMLNCTENTFLIEPTLVPAVMEYVFDRGMSPGVNESLLTPREREIVCLLREGYDRSSIAKQLCIAETTLKTHIKNIARKRDKEAYEDNVPQFSY